MHTVVTADQLQAWWQDLNARFFHNCLPPLMIHWSQRLTSSSRMFVSALGPRAIFRDSARTEALSKYMPHWVNCGRVYRRSIRPNRHRCGVCPGRLKEMPLATVSG